MAPLVLVAYLTTKWFHLHCLQSWPPGCRLRHLHCNIALSELSVSIGFVSSSARVNSVKFQKGLGVSDIMTSGLIDQIPGLPGSDKNISFGSPKTLSWCDLSKFLIVMLMVIIFILSLLHNCQI